jgi:hypothetical protein
MKKQGKNLIKKQLLKELKLIKRLTSKLTPSKLKKLKWKRSQKEKLLRVKR